MRFDHLTGLLLAVAVAGAGCYPEVGPSRDRWESCVNGSGRGSARLADLPPSGTPCEGDGWGCTGGDGGATGWSLFCVRGRMAVVSYTTPPAAEECAAFRSALPRTTADSCRLDLVWCGPTGLVRADVVEHGCANDGPLAPGSQPPGNCGDTLRSGRPGDPCEGAWSCAEMRGGLVDAVWCAAGTLHFAEVPFA